MQQQENIERSVKRLGRFDIKIEMYFPDAKERKEIIEYWCQNEISTSEDSFMIAKKCFGKSFLKIIHIMDGAKEDLINAERLLRKYLVEYCFDDELGIVPISSINVSLLAGTDVNNQVLNRIKELLNKFYEETKKIITEHKDMVTENFIKIYEKGFNPNKYLD